MCLALSCCPQGNPRGNLLWTPFPPLTLSKATHHQSAFYFMLCLQPARQPVCPCLPPSLSLLRSASGLCFCPRRWCLFKMITLRTRWRSREKTNVCYWGVKIFHYKYTWSENPTLSSLCVIFRIKVWALVYLWLWLWLCQLLLLFLLFSPIIHENWQQQRANKKNICNYTIIVLFFPVVSALKTVWLTRNQKSFGKLKSIRNTKLYCWRVFI